MSLARSSEAAEVAAVVAVAVAVAAAAVEVLSKFGCHPDPP